jgi:hypothetical protein
MDKKERQQSLNLKTQGMNAAAEANPKPLSIAREIAVEIAIQGNGITDSEQVRTEMLRRGVFPNFKKTGKPANWMGSIFKRKGEWESVGMKNNSHKPAHGRLVQRWHYIG